MVHISAKQMHGELRKYVVYRLLLPKMFPQGCAILFKARVIMIQKHVCHDTSDREAGVPSDDVEDPKSVRVI